VVRAITSVQCRPQRQIHEEQPITGAHDGGHPATGFGHADHFPQHLVRIDFFHDRHRQGHIRALVRKRERFCTTFAKLYRALESLFLGKGCGFAQQIPIDIYAHDAVVSPGILGQPADEDATATPHLDDRLPRPQGHLRQQSPEHAEVARGVPA
jgi:hypothetical protein